MYDSLRLISDSEQELNIPAREKRKSKDEGCLQSIVFLMSKCHDESTEGLLTNYTKEETS